MYNIIAYVVTKEVYQSMKFPVVTVEHVDTSVHDAWDYISRHMDYDDLEPFNTIIKFTPDQPYLYYTGIEYCMYTPKYIRVKYTIQRKTLTLLFD